MKKNYRLFLLLILSLSAVFFTATAQLENSRLIITSGIDYGNLKQTIENSVSQMLYGCNEAVINGKSPSVSKEAITADGRRVLGALWRTSPMSCSVSTLERVCVLRPNDSGFQIRNIPVTMHNAPEGQQYQEIVINLTNEGKVDDIFIPIHQYSDILSNDLKVADFNRRQMVIDFVENFRTAYNRRDINFLENAFSDNALIITGKVIKQKPNSDQVLKSLPQEKIVYQNKTKKEYLDGLKSIFKNKKYLNVEFEEVIVLQHETYEEVYGVTLLQRWYSTGYNDVGYVFLMIDFKNEWQPEIHVRTWQPEIYDGRKLRRDEVFQIYDFALNRIN
ncbi:hypothetical protein D0T49_06860 [Paludibacter sp. 221]|uniref:hypothetical protein n=1 Tax=Paludibacter sp. 221 TaxID=2302939 RepID=UPI0013D30307|nr:hypothetical protein [Paludibacter sp. 221]NDV46764.1 hypothetical protein [Paludibacter sp. 221]